MGKYGVILADPPWDYRNSGLKTSARTHYPTMTTEQIGKLPVGDFARQDSILLLWATWPNLTVAFEIMDFWGFEYVTGFPWVKVKSPPVVDLWGETRLFPAWGIGFWIRGCSEPILIGRKGNPERPNRDFLGLISEKLGHSRKPDNLYHYAEAMPGPYLELFARRIRPGWDAWGNEVVSAINLTESATKK